MLWGVPPITDQQIATATGRASGGAANANADASGNTAGASGKAAELIAAAKSQLGVPYVYGAHAWGKALDCSGFTQGAFKQIGIDLGGDSYAQVKQGTAVQGGIANAVPGDLVFATGDIGMRTNGHVAIYLGNGKVIAAPHTGANVEIEDWSHNTSITAIRRII